MHHVNPESQFHQQPLKKYKLPYFFPRYHFPIFDSFPDASNIAIFGPTLLTSARNAPNQLYRST